MMAAPVMASAASFFAPRREVQHLFESGGKEQLLYRNSGAAALRESGEDRVREWFERLSL